MKLRNLFKTTSKFLLTLLVIIGVTAEVSAADKSLTIYKEDWAAPYSTLETFHVKKVSGTNKYVYCAEYAKRTPNYVTYNLGNEITDAGEAYILSQGANNSDNNSYFITQSALWIYMYDKGLMSTCNNASNCPSVANLRKEVYAANGPTATAIQKLVADAKTKTSLDNTLNLSTNTSNLTFTLSSDKKYYVSNDIKVTSNGNYEVSITDAPKGTTKEDVSGGFRIKVPADKVTELTTNVKVKITSNKTVYRSYIYNPVENKYQTVAVINSEKLNKDLTVSGTIKTTKVTISKTDAATSKELPGAELKLVCDNGYSYSWTSGNTPKVLTDVPEGKCTLTETNAPKGYVKTTETITFEVVAGKVTAKQVMKNAPRGSVTISKTDATNGEELPNAELKLVCNNGKYVKTWISGTTPKVLTDVPDGTCELSETIAPDGYIRETETITFEVKDGKTTGVVEMKNKPSEKTYEVEISKVDIATSEELAGATLQVTNEKGNVVCEWTSDGTTHTCKNLVAGTYTLTEIAPPDGYQKAESITFTIDKDGKLTQNGEPVDKIVMVDAPETTVVEVPDTLSLRTSLPYILGFIIIISGAGLVINSVKKNEEQ